MIVQRDFGFADLRARGATPFSAKSAHLEQVGKVAREGERKCDTEGMITMVLQAQALIDCAVQKKDRAHDVQHVLRLNKLLIEIDIGVG